MWKMWCHSIPPTNQSWETFQTVCNSCCVVVLIKLLPHKPGGVSFWLVTKDVFTFFKNDYRFFFFFFFSSWTRGRAQVLRKLLSGSLLQWNCKTWAFITLLMTTFGLQHPAARESPSNHTPTSCSVISHEPSAQWHHLPDTPAVSAPELPTTLF